MKEDIVDKKADSGRGGGVCAYIRSGAGEDRYWGVNTLPSHTHSYQDHTPGP